MFFRGQIANHFKFHQLIELISRSFVDSAVDHIKIARTLGTAVGSMGVQTEVLGGLPGQHGVSHEPRHIVCPGYIVLTIQLVLRVFLPGSRQVCREALAFVVGRQLESENVGVAHVVVLNEVHVDEVTRTVVESVEFDVESFDQLSSTEGQLIGVHTLRGQWHCQLRTALSAHERHEHLVGLAIKVRCVDEGFGIAEFDIPLGLYEDECHTRRELTDMGGVVALLVVVAQTGIEDNRSPLMLQLQKTVGIILMSFAYFGDIDRLRD